MSVSRRRYTSYKVRQTSRDLDPSPQSTVSTYNVRKIKCVQLRVQIRILSAGAEFTKN